MALKPKSYVWSLRPQEPRRLCLSGLMGRNHPSQSILVTRPLPCSFLERSAIQDSPTCGPPPRPSRACAHLPSQPSASIQGPGMRHFSVLGLCTFLLLALPETHKFIQRWEPFVWGSSSMRWFLLSVLLPPDPCLLLSLVGNRTWRGHLFFTLAYTVAVRE